MEGLIKLDLIEVVLCSGGMCREVESSFLYEL